MVFTNNIQYGSSGLDVTYIQERLNELNFDLGHTGVDSLFGKNTKWAVEKFQKSVHIPVTGVVDKNTWDKLFGTNIIRFNEYMTPTNYINMTPFGRNCTYIDSIKDDIRTIKTNGEKLYENININSYVQHLALGETMPLPVNPTELTEQVGAEWSPTAIPGRSSAFYHYTGTSNRVINYSMKLHVDLGEIMILSGGGYSKSGIDIEDFINFMQSLCYPIYNCSGIKPPVCRLVIEDVINARVIFNSVSITKSGPMRKYLSGERAGQTSYVMYDCSFSVMELPERTLNARIVKNGWK